MAFSLGLWVWAPSQSLKNGQKKGTLSLLKKNTAFRWVFPKNPMVGTNTTISDFREKGMISAGETPWSALYASWQWMANWKWPCPLTSVLPNHMQISRVFLPWMSIQSCMCTYNEICHMCVCTNIWLYMYIYIIYICHIVYVVLMENSKKIHEYGNITYVYIYTHIYIYTYIYIYT